MGVDSEFAGLLVAVGFLVMGWPCDGVLVEASLLHEAKATANGRRHFVVLLKQRRRVVQNGYRDGYHKGQQEGREKDPGDINVRALEKATHRYQSWMGPVEDFQDGYRDGYRRGFRMGYQATNRGWRDRDYDDDYRY